MYPRIVVLGSFNMDLMIKTSRRPKIGETVIGDSFNMACGGKGFNQAVAAARLGADVRMIGMVGDDDYGKRFIDQLKQEKIRHDAVIQSGDSKTGIGCPIVDDQGDNQIIIVPGANMDLRVEDIEKTRELILDADLLMLQLEIPLEVNTFAAKLAKDHNIPVLLNPAPFCKLPQQLLKNVSVFIPNETECMQLTNILVEDEKSAQEAAHIIHEMGIDTVVITMGEKGAFYSTKDKRELIPSFPVKAVDTTAAGDAFCAAFAYQYLLSKDMHFIVRFANAVGALTTTVLGAEPSLPKIDKVNQFFARENKDQ